MEKGKIVPFPKFYIKYVGGRYSVEHRLTHSWLSTVDTEKELKQEIRRLNEIPEQELWEFLLYKRSASVVPERDFESRFQHEEDWYFSAWGIFTTRFYESNPKLLMEVDSIPYDLVNAIKRERRETANEEYKRRREEIAREEVNRKRREKAEKDRVELGDMEKLKKIRIKKKAKKTVKFKKRRSGDNFKTPVVSVNPFD